MTSLIDMLRQAGAIPTTVAINASTSGDGNILVAAVAGKTIAVLAFGLTSAGTVNAKFRSFDGTSTYTDLAGPWPLVAQKDIPGGAPGTFDLFHTLNGQALTMNLSGTIAVSGYLQYLQG